MSAAIDRVYRIVRLVELLQSSGRTLSNAQLAKQLNVTERTVFRDLALLRDCGIGNGAGDLPPQYRASGSSVISGDPDVEELASLFVLGDRLGGEKEGIPFFGPARAAAMKLLARAPSHVRGAIEQMAASVSIELGPHAQAGEQQSLFDTLRRGVTERRCVQIRCRTSDDEDVVTNFSPYHLLFKWRSWVVIGRSSWHRSVVVINLECIAGADLLREKFKRPARFRLEQFFGNSWHLARSRRQHTVAVRFNRKVAREIAAITWHNSQVVQWNADGSAILRMTVDGLDEIASWIVGYGIHAEVLHPVELREHIATIVRRLHAVYCRDAATARPCG